MPSASGAAAHGAAGICPPGMCFSTFVSAVGVGSCALLSTPTISGGWMWPKNQMKEEAGRSGPASQKSVRFYHGRGYLPFANACLPWARA